MIDTGKAKFSYSFSQDRMYRECPMQYKFRYFDGISTPSNTNLDLGNAVHKVCQEWNNFVQNKIVDDSDLAKAINYIIAAKGNMYLSQLSDELKQFFKLTMYREHECTISDNSKEFTARLDIIYTTTDDQTIIGDFKVTKHPKTVDSIYEEGQLLFYKWLCKQDQHTTGIENPKFQYINILPYISDRIVIPTLPVEIKDDKTTEFVDAVCENVLKINNHIFPKTGKYCRWCPYIKMCLHK